MPLLRRLQDSNLCSLSTILRLASGTITTLAKRHWLRVGLLLWTGIPIYCLNIHKTPNILPASISCRHISLGLSVRIELTPMDSQTTMLNHYTTKAIEGGTVRQAIAYPSVATVYEW